MHSHRRAVLLTLLAVALALLLFDVHGAPDQLLADLRATWADLHGSTERAP